MSESRQRSVLLGLFIVLQLAFLVLQNFVTFLQDARSDMPADVRDVVRQLAADWPEKKGYAWNIMEGTTQVTHRWSQVTLQLQQWSLFAPSISRDCVFPALLLSDDDPSRASVEATDSVADYSVRGKVMLSENEPVDMKSYVRWGNFRLRRFENNLVIYLRPRDEETPKETAERFRDRIKELAGEYTEVLTQYVQVRLRQENAPPSHQVILLLRRYALRGAETGADFFDGPFTVPAIRWLPDAEGALNAQGLEFFNPVTQRFERLKS